MFAATTPNQGGDYVVQSELVKEEGAYVVKYVGHFAVPESHHINGLTRFVHDNAGYTATTDKDFGVYLFQDPKAEAAHGPPGGRA